MLMNDELDSNKCVLGLLQLHFSDINRLRHRWAEDHPECFGKGGKIGACKYNVHGDRCGFQQSFTGQSIRVIHCHLYYRPLRSLTRDPKCSFCSSANFPFVSLMIVNTRL